MLSCISLKVYTKYYTLSEELLRKAIPGLEKKQFSWMRSIINAGGTIA